MDSDTTVITGVHPFFFFFASKLRIDITKTMQQQPKALGTQTVSSCIYCPFYEHPHNILRQGSFTLASPLITYTTSPPETPTSRCGQLDGDMPSRRRQPWTCTSSMPRTRFCKQIRLTRREYTHILSSACYNVGYQ